MSAKLLLKSGNCLSTRCNRVTVVDKTTAFDVSTGPAGTTTSIASIVATSATTTVTLAATGE